jgi:hypothetical protein
LRIAAGGRLGLSLGEKHAAQIEAAATQGKGRGRGYGEHTRQTTDAVGDSFESGEGLWRSGVAGARQGDLNGQKIRGRKSRVDFRELPETADQESRACEQNHSERDFGNH